MKSRRLWIVVGIIILVVLTSSGWVFNMVRSNNQTAQTNEMAVLQTTFVQQYGSKAVIKQLVSPTKVYAATATGIAGDNITCILWNIGGYWAVVGTLPQSAPTP